MNEALEQARRDPALGAWLERERGFDAAVSAKLGGITPPLGLREAILSGSRVSARRRGWRSPGWMALAACLAVVVGGGLFAMRLRGGGVPDGLVALALQDMVHGHHDGLTKELEPFQKPLANPVAALGRGIPFDESKLGGADCRSLDFHGRKVFELCFVRGGLVFHLYMMPLGGGGGATAPVYSSSGALSTAAWTDAHHAYVLASKLGIAALERVIQGG